MASNARAEHRQQRIRGAGLTGGDVQAGFDFSSALAGLSRRAKQTSLPPQRSSRRTPVASTPRSAIGSAKRHRSVSVQRSSGRKRSSTPRERITPREKPTPRARFTPQLGKRKRGSKHAEAGEDDGELDPLSPDADPDLPKSVEKSRKAPVSVSPIFEHDDEDDGLPDEISLMDDVLSSVQKAGGDTSWAARETPAPAIMSAPLSPGSAREPTPLARKAARLASITQQEKDHPGRRAKSMGPAPVTPAVARNRQKRHSSTSAAQPGSNAATTRAHESAEESDDQLSPSQVNTSSAAMTKTKFKKTNSPQFSPDDEDLDDLSPEKDEHRPTSTSITNEPEQTPAQNRMGHKKSLGASKSQKANRFRPIVQDEEDEEEGQEEQEEEEEEEEEENSAQPTPVHIIQRSAKSRIKNSNVEKVVAEEDIDELTPIAARKTLGSIREAASTPHPDAAMSGDSEGSEYQVDNAHRRPALISQPRSPPKKKQRITPSITQHPKKRQKRGPTQAIKIMRLKGFAVKGFTVADTTHTVVEDWIQHQLQSMMNKISITSDAVRRKDLRRQQNILLVYKEQLEDTLNDLEDINDAGTHNIAQYKKLNRQNKELRKEYMDLQRDRDQIALENDQVTEEFLREKKEVDDRNKLSQSMYDVQMAIRNGKAKARKEGREAEGPEKPITMLLENVARDVGSTGGGGLLACVRKFNGMLDRAAGFLEGRA